MRSSRATNDARVSTARKLIGLLPKKEYKNTRHNIGFEILDAFAEASNICFTPDRYGDVAIYKFKGHSFLLIKPSTYVNLSGKAVNYWLQKEKIQLENLLVVLDDLALPFGSIRLKPGGSDAGHNGLKHIQSTVGTTTYSRLRFGIGDNFSKGKQVNYVLGKWSNDELFTLEEHKTRAVEIIKSFGIAGVQKTMNLYNKK